MSISTVSRYLTGQQVRRAEQIEAAIQKLGYRPNAAARGLRLRSMEAIAVFVHDITNPFASALVQGVQSIAGSRRFSLYLAGGSDDVEGNLLDIGARVDGIICAAASEGSGVIDVLERIAKPVVLVEFEPSDHAHSFDVIVVDNIGGSERAVEHLIDLGHRRIGVIAGPDEISVGRERLQGVRKAVEAASEPVELIVETSDFSEQGGYQATARLVGHRPTALFAPNNLTSIGALRCLRDLGVEIPGGLSFVGFDPLHAGDLMRPSPTFVDRPEVEQGALAMRMLEGRMNGATRAAPSRIQLTTTLAVRGSTGPPPRIESPGSPPAEMEP